MKNVLHIVSSARGNDSYSFGLSSAIVNKLKATHDIGTVVEKNLTTETPPFLNESLLKAFYKQPNTISHDENCLLNYSNSVFNEIQEADIIVIGTPMHNLGVSAPLKAWIDQLIRVGKTYRYNQNATITGLLNDKKVFLAIASGGAYSEDCAKNEFIESYIKATFSTYAGITDISTLRVHGTAYPNFRANYEEIIQDI